MTRLTLLLLALAACEPSAKDTADTSGDTGDTATDTADTEDTADTSDTADTGEPAPEATAVLTTSDYVSGSMATVKVGGTTVTEDVFPAGSDAVVVAEGARLFVLTRSTEDTVAVFDDLDFSAPTVEFSTGDASNPQSVATCGGNLFVTLYAKDWIGVYEPAGGQQVGSVDLSAYSDDDGTPEASTMVLGADGYLYVALEQLDYLSTYASLDGSGTLVKVDCTAMEVVDSWDVGPNPRVTQGAGDTLIVYGGDYYLPDWSGPALDGGLWIFDTATGTLSDALVTEADLGANIGNVAVSGDAAFFTLDDGLTWESWCLDLGDGTPTLAGEPLAYVTGARTAPDGTVWALQRADFAGNASEIGTVVYDVGTCAATTTFTTTLPPYSLAFVTE